MDVVDEGLGQLAACDTHLQVVEGFFSVASLLCKHLEFDEIFFGRRLSLSEVLELKGSIGSFVGQVEDLVNECPELGIRGRLFWVIEDFVGDMLSSLDLASHI